MTQSTETSKAPGAPEKLSTALGTVTPIVTMSRDGLVLVALAWSIDVSPTYDTATAAAAKGDLELRELGGGTVPTIEAVTKKRPVVIFAGDTIVGGLQNRIINVSVWLKAAAVTPIPVSCLEAGRWNAGSRFEAGRKVDYNLRARVSEQVEERTRYEDSAWAAEGAPPSGRHASFAADQGAIWNEIAAKQARASVHSPTAALHQVYEREAADLARSSKRSPAPRGATGVAVGIDGRVIAIELFDSATTLQEQWPRLVESAASAYLDQRRAVAAGLAPKPVHRHPDDGALGRMLARARHALDGAVVGPSVGEGVDVRLSGKKVRGGALVVDDRPIHVELFRAEA